MNKVLKIQTSWSDPNFPTLDFTKHQIYAKNHNQEEIKLKSSEILFAGSCDISGPVKNKYWYEYYCEEKGLNHNDYIKIGTIGQPLQALVRKIYCWIKSIEQPPKTIFMVSPASMPEHVCESVAWPLPRNLDKISFIEKLNIVPDTVLYRMVPLMVSLRQVTGPGQLIYEFCQNFSFLEMLTKAYNINFYWTPNLTINAAEYFEPNIEMFLNSHEFAKKTFLGYDTHIIDKKYSGLDFPSDISHRNIANKFLQK